MNLLSNLGLLSAIAGVSLTSTAAAQTPFLDDFDSYALGSVINGQGGWKQWGGGANTTSIIEDSTTGFARSGNSVSINTTGAAGAPTSDLVHEFTGFTSGQHTMRAYTYAPTGMLDKWFFMVLNTYSDPGPFLWTVVVELTPASGIWSAYHGTATPNQGPLILDQWVELRAQIDLTANLVEVFYDGASTAPAYSWTAGYAGTDAGALNIACVDLYHNPLVTSPAGRAYYDDFGLTNGFPPPAPTTFCVPKVNSQGCTPLMGSTGFSSASSGSGFVLSAVNAINNKPGLFLYSDGGQVAVPFFGGTRCVGNPPTNPVRRSVAMNSGGNAPPNDCSGAFTMDWNTFSVGGLGGTPQSYLVAPGTVVQVQAWGRDPGFPAGLNAQLSDGLEYTVGV